MFGTLLNSIGTLWKSAFLLLACILITGCERSESFGECFNDASPKVKQTWEQAVRLDKADKYMSAAETYDSLFSMGLTTSQRKTVESAISQMNERVHKQAAEGDPDAKKLVELIDGAKVGGK